MIYHIWYQARVDFPGIQQSSKGALLGVEGNINIDFLDERSRSHRCGLKITNKEKPIRGGQGKSHLECALQNGDLFYLLTVGDQRW